MKLLSTAHKDVFINTINNYMNNITFCSRNDLRTLPIDMPVVFRNFTANRKEIRIVQKTGRPWYYMDCGYFANITPRKSFMRIVPNDIQHSKPRYDLPANRFNDQCKIAELSGHGHPLRFSKWKKDGAYYGEFSISTFQNSKGDMVIYGNVEPKFFENFSSKASL